MKLSDFDEKRYFLSEFIEDPAGVPNGYIVGLKVYDRKNEKNTTIRLTKGEAYLINQYSRACVASADAHLKETLGKLLGWIKDG